jgi:hypothetical protein
VPPPSGSAEQGTLPFVGLGDELSANGDEVVRLRAEDERLLRLLELMQQQARLAIGPDGASNDRRCSAAPARQPEPVGRRL